MRIIPHRNPYSKRGLGSFEVSISGLGVHTGLTNGKTYYFVVTAVNVYGESSESNELHTTPATTQDKTWGIPTMIGFQEAGHISFYYPTPDVAMDPSGNAIAVWYYWDGVHYRIGANRYVAGTGWDAPVQIDNNSEDAYEPRVAIDSNGNAIAVWHQYKRTNFTYDIWVNHYVSNIGWGVATLLDTNTDWRPDIAMDSNGNATIAWQKNGSVYASRYTVGVGWGTPVWIGLNPVIGTSPHVGMDSWGNAIVVWNNGQYIYVNRYSVGLGWGSDIVIGVSGAYDSTGWFDPDIAVDSSGNAIVAWRTGDYTTYSNRYAVGTGWDTATPIETNSLQPFCCDSPQVAVDSNGTAIAVWTEYDDSNLNVYANRFVVGFGWGMATLIENDTGIAYKPQIAMDSVGNGTVVWQQNLGIYANRYVFGSGWSTPVLIETSPQGGLSPEVAVDINGNAMAVWYQYDGTYYTIWANSFQ